ncbi:MAG: cation-translocating P-type ATPase [Kineosporiaceae bacterium]|nr:cation-translocating P-type ATPase [Aeromicrobium sp.]
MTSGTTVSGNRSESREPPTRPTRRDRNSYAWLATGIATAALTVAVAVTPLLHFTGWRWLALALATALAASGGSAMHKSARAKPDRGFRHVDMLSVIAIVATYVWMLATIGSDEAGHRIALTAVVATLVITSRHVSGRDHTPDGGAAPRWLLPGVLCLALASLAAWWILEDLSAACSAAVAVLIIACSAGLALATPAALLVGRKRGTGIGLHVGGMAALDAARRIDTIVIDKDRTITTGELGVKSIDPIDPDHERNLRWFAGALEHGSSHPVGRAIAKLAGRGHLTNVEQQPGLGISGSVDRHPVRVGRPTWVGLESVTGVGTTVGVEVDGRALGHITVTDTVRPHARDGIAELRQLGLQPILVSDGNLLDTEHLATLVGIDAYFAELGDEQRSDLILELQKGGHTVALVGDRSTNAGALESADLAIAPSTDPGGSVADTGIGVAKLDVSVVARAIRLSRETLAKAQTNRRLALAAIVVPAPFAAVGLINPLFATLIAVVTTALIGVNSLRLRPPGPR